MSMISVCQPFCTYQTNEKRENNKYFLLPVGKRENNNIISSQYFQQIGLPQRPELQIYRYISKSDVDGSSNSLKFVVCMYVPVYVCVYRLILWMWLEREEF